jgi:cobalt-zinc-cadmium efflux system outer membrane protein
VLATLVVCSAARPDVRDAVSADPLTLEDAFALAAASSPALAAARLEVPIATAAIGVARQRQNPDLAIESARETPHDALSLTFPIETAGKRGRRIDVAEAVAATSEATLVRATIELRVKVRRAFYALCAAERSATEASQLGELAARTSAAVSERFNSGDAPKLELLQAEMAAAQAASEAATARVVVETRRTALNVLLGRAPEAATLVRGDLGEGRVPDQAAATALAISSNRELAVLDRRLEEQDQRVRLARAQRWPDFDLTAAVTHDDPEFDWGWRAGVSSTLPLFHHHRAEARVEEAILAQLRAQRDAQAAEIRGTVVSAWSLADARAREYATYRDQVLVTASEVESMVEESYRSGQSGLLAMIQSISAVRDARARAINAGQTYQEALADLEQAMGAPIP